MGLSRKAVVFLFLFLILLSGCQKRQDINILSYEKYLLLPFYIEENYGKLTLKDGAIKLTYVKNSAGFIRFLNLSKYNVVIIDSFTFDFLRRMDDSWVKVCEIAEKTPAIYKLQKGEGSGRFYALNTPVYRNLIKEDVLFVGSFDNLKDKKRIYFKDLLPKFTKLKGIGKLNFYLCVRKNSPAIENENLKTLLSILQEGIVYTNDPVVVRYVSSIKHIESSGIFKFKNCF